MTPLQIPLTLPNEPWFVYCASILLSHTSGEHLFLRRVLTDPSSSSCASSPGNSDIHLASARALAHAFHRANISLVYGGGTRGIMGELAKSLVSLSGPQAVHGVIPRALIRTEKGYDGTPVGREGEGNGQKNLGRENGGQDDEDEDAGGKKAEKVLSRDELERVDSQTHADRRSSNEDDGSDNKTKLVGVEIYDPDLGTTTVVPDMHTRKRLMCDLVLRGGPGSGFVALAGGYGTIEEVMEMVTWNQLGIHALPIVLVNVAGYWDGLLGWVRNSVQQGFVGKGSAGILVEVHKPDEAVDALARYTVAEGRYLLDWSR